jgi:hypothetical protein
MREAIFADRRADGDAQLAFAVETEIADGAGVGPRETGSSSSMISIARNFGAPVMLPPGKQAASAAKCVTLRAQAAFHGGNQMLHLREAFEPAPSSGTCTEPNSQTLPRSLRSRSVIITSSASSLALVWSS